MPCVSVRQECQRSRSSSTNPKSGSIPMTLVLSGWWKSGANAPRTTGRMQLLEASLPPRCLAPGGCEGSRHPAERVCPRHGGVTSWPCQPTGPRRRRGRRRPEGSSVSSSPPSDRRVSGPADTSRTASVLFRRHQRSWSGPTPQTPRRAHLHPDRRWRAAHAIRSPPVPTGRASARVNASSLRLLGIGAGTCHAVETVMAARP